MRGRRFFLHAAIVLATGGSALAAGTTRWTGAAGDRQWANPANWTGGVPDADTVARFTGSDASGITVDLGGATRAAAGVEAFMGLASELRVINGTLSTPDVNAASRVTIESRLTTTAPLMRLAGDVHVSGFVSGNMDVIANGTFSGPVQHLGTTTVSGSLTLDDTQIVRRPVRMTPGARLTLQGENTVVGELQSDAGWVEQLTPSDGGPTVGTLRFTSGQSTVASHGGEFDVIDLVRSDGATVHLRGPGRILASRLDAPAAGTASRVTSWMVAPAGGGDWTFARAELSSRGLVLRPMDLATEYVSDFAGGTNVRLTSNATRSTTARADSLSLSGADLTLNASLFLDSGGVIMSGGSTGRASIRGTGAMALGLENDGVIHVFKPQPGDGPSGTFSIEVPVSARMLTKSGDGELVLTSRRNAFPLGVSLNGGTLTAAAQGAIGPGGNGPGTIRFNPGTTLRLDYANPVLSQGIVLNGPGSGYTALNLRPGEATLGGPVSGDGNLVIGLGEGMGSGPLTVRLTGSGAETGAYRLNAGGTTLAIDGNYASPDSTIFAGSRTYGTGTVRGELWNTGNELSPGPAWGAAGRMTVGTFSSYGATFYADLAGRAAGTEYDQLVVLDRTFLQTDPQVSSLLELAIAPGFTPSPGDQFVLVDNRFSGPVEGRFQNLPEGTRFSAGGSDWWITYVGGDGNDIAVTVVPEPAALPALAAVAALVLRRRPRRVLGAAQARMP